MARGVRIQYAGAYYHVMARGNRREASFLDDDDRSFFLATLGKACTMTGRRFHAWVLMNNHYHLFLETPAPNLVAGMQWLQNTFTRRFNVRPRAWSRVFGDRYKAVMVQSEGGNYHKSRGSDPRKAVIAKVLRQRTTVSQDWLAQRLHMKSAANVSQDIKRITSETSSARNNLLPPKLKKWVTCVEI